MKQSGFFYPENFQFGDKYYLRDDIKEKSEYIQVIFQAYRPHPGELLVNVNGEIKVIHRRYLFSESPGNDKMYST